MSEKKSGANNIRFSSKVCLLLNRFFPSVERPGREDPMEYADAQYQWAKTSLSYFKDQIELKDKIILDAGCSLGGKTIYYSEKGVKSIVGIDLDVKRTEHANQYANKKNKKIELVVEYYNRRMIKGINSLKIIPFINKYLTTRAIYILTK